MADGFEVAMGLIGVFFSLIWILFILVAILGTIFWVFMIIDVAKREFKQENDKLLWLLIVLLGGMVGALIYYFVVKRNDKNLVSKN